MPAINFAFCSPLQNVPPPAVKFPSAAYLRSTAERMHVSIAPSFPSFLSSSLAERFHVRLFRACILRSSHRSSLPPPPSPMPPISISEDDASLVVYDPSDFLSFLLDLIPLSSRPEAVLH